MPACDRLTCISDRRLRTSLREWAEALPFTVSAAIGSMDGRIFCVCRRTLLRRSSGRPCVRRTRHVTPSCIELPRGLFLITLLKAGAQGRNGSC